MELTLRQQKILHSLIKEYVDSTEPISSNLLKKRYHLDVSPATIRNELQNLTQKGYLAQPHTSAGRVPTEKAYHYFVEVIFTEHQPALPSFISKELEIARQKIEKELLLAQELMASLQEISYRLHAPRVEDKTSMIEILKIIGPSQNNHDRNIDMIRELLKELENL